MNPFELLSSLSGRLREWLPGQRWFAGKGQAVDRVEPLRATWLGEGDPGLVHGLISVRQGDTRQVYQLLIGLRADPDDHLPVIGPVTGAPGGLTAFEASADPELAVLLLGCFAAGAVRDGLRFDVEPGVALETELHARPVGAEQSNTSIVFGDSAILKLYRRPHPGPNRDLELHRALAGVGSEHVAQPLGSLQADLDGEPAVLGFLQRFLPGAAEGWATATASVRDLMAEEDLHADEVGGDFAGEAHRLGAAVASVHAELAQAVGSRRAGPDEVRGMVDAMHARLDRVLIAVPEIAGHATALRETYDAIRGETLSLQEIHGDLHLGQTLRTTAGWVLIDFEGEPAATVAERASQGSPLRDVAGMLRSFDYAAHQLTVGEPEERRAGVRASEWSERNRDAFCEGYAEIGADPREHPALLRAFELDKAVYEVGYEHANRPDWLPIPMHAIARLVSHNDR